MRLTCWSFWVLRWKKALALSCCFLILVAYLCMSSMSFIWSARRLRQNSSLSLCFLSHDPNCSYNYLMLSLLALLMRR